MSEPLAQVVVDGDQSAPSVRIVGEVDVSNVDAVSTSIDELADAADALTLDLTGVAYFDSTGVRLIQSLVDRHTAGSLDLTLVVSPTDVAGRLLSLTGVDRGVPIHDPHNGTIPQAAPHDSAPHDGRA